MERIPLRQYCQTIENLISNSRPDEALDRCQQILAIYPQFLDVFRLMGKAHLELREYDKAEAAFQKVISSIPDDFVANVGLSQIREKQTNLNGAIWHMERAHEAQRGNNNIQNELRRLYKLRDGVGTSRLPSTTGSLIRMYLNQDMLSNAINESNSVLTDDPSRVDIKVYLAQANFRNGRKDEAVQVCREILRDLPYCFEANRILYEMRSPATKADDMKLYKQRLTELDPYFEFTSPEHPDVKKVPDEKVLLEVPSETGPKTATRGMPENLSFSPSNGFGNGASSEGNNGPDSRSGSNVPSWMQGLQSPTQANEGSNTGTTAGENPATPTSGFNFGKNMTIDEPTPRDSFPSGPDNSQNANQPGNPFLSSSGGAIPAAEPGDIPEWLKALAAEPPAASSDAITAPLRVPGETGVLQTGEENLDFLRNFSTEQSDEPAAPPVVPELPAERPMPPQGPIESLPGILPPSPFLSSSETTQPVPVEDNSTTEEKSTGRDMPGWLRSAVEPSKEEDVVETPAVVDFRQDFDPEPFQLQTPPVPPPSFQSSPFEMDETVTAPVSDEEIPTPEIEQYLEQLRKDITPTDQPEWLKKENLGNELEALFEDQKKPVQPTPEPQPEQEQPDWMRQLKEEEPSTPAQPAAAVPASALPENVPDWLFTPEGEADGSTAPIQNETPVTHQPPPDWLAAARPDIFGSELEQNLEQPAASPAIPGESDVTGVIKDEPVQESLPAELDFLKSAPIDFMNADRSHLTDNLSMPADQPVPADEIDFTKAAPVENLPADLAALLREETEQQQIHTMPIKEESISSLPGFSLEMQIPGLEQPEENQALPSPTGQDTPFSVEAFMEDALRSEAAAAETAAAPASFESGQPVEANLPDWMKTDTTLFASEPQPVQPVEAAPSITEIEPEGETIPISETEVPGVIEPSLFAEEIKPDDYEAAPSIAAPVAQEIAHPEPAPAPVVVEPTIPVNRLVQEPTIPISYTPVQPESAVQAEEYPDILITPLEQEQTPDILITPLEQEQTPDILITPLDLEQAPDILITPLEPEQVASQLEPTPHAPVIMAEPVAAAPVPVVEPVHPAPPPVIKPEPVAVAPAPVVIPEPPAPAPVIAPEPVAAVPVAVVEPEPVPPAPAPVVKPEPVAVAPTPVVKPEPVPPVPAPVAKPEPVVAVPVSVPEPEPVKQPVIETSKPEPVIAAPRPSTPKPVAAPRPAPSRPVSAPRPAYKPEKPVAIPQPGAQRKNAGIADLTRAREAAAHGDLATALRRYIKLINSSRALDQVSADLKEITRKNPKNYLAWQTYGDARLRSNRIQEALDAYAKAADLLK